MAVIRGECVAVQASRLPPRGRRTGLLGLYARSGTDKFEVVGHRFYVLATQIKGGGGWAEALARKTLG